MKNTKIKEPFGQIEDAEEFVEGKEWPFDI